MTDVTIDWHAIILALIIVFVGAFAGLTNFLVYYFQEKKDKRDKKIIIKYILSGIGAAILIPLLLNMLSSNLIKDSKEFDTINYFVFAGFCFVAGYFSDRFINSIGEKILRDLKATKDTAEEAIDSAKAAEDKIDALVLTETESDAVEEDIDVVEELPEYLLNPDDPMTKILKSFGNAIYKFRTVVGISQFTNLKPDYVIWKLIKMEEEGIARKINSKSNKTLWSLTFKGRELLKRLM